MPRARGSRWASVRESAKRVGLEATAGVDQRQMEDWVTKRPFASEDD